MARSSRPWFKGPAPEWIEIPASVDLNRLRELVTHLDPPADRCLTARLDRLTTG
jgi:hypothetical protein